MQNTAENTAFWASALIRRIGGLSRISADGPFKVFIVGTGRSGTHWLSHIFQNYPSNHVTIEKEPIFSWVVEMARCPETESALFPKLVRRYRAEHSLVLPKHYVDKSHPNIWLAEKLAQQFPEARFIAIRRNLEPTVASMLVHEGVRHWVKAWDADPRPNRFLGVDQSLVQVYRQMSTAGRCAVRVIGHAREIERLKPVLGKRLHFVTFEDLYQKHEVELDRLSNFLGEQTPENVPKPNLESLEKWRGQLSNNDLQDIRRVAELLDARHLLADPAVSLQ